MKNSEIEIYFNTEKFKWNYNYSKNHYELTNLYLTNQDLNNLIKTINFFNFSVCLCNDRLIVHHYKATS
jgi:hypothetical protein